jgi:XTP/dITP diphosphohydrolase
VNRVLVATTNRGKLAELRPMLTELGWAPVGLDSFPDVGVAAEDADDLAGNARSKALHYAAATGLPALADDSGLEVAALDGAPGVRSARFAGPDADDRANCERLLSALAGTDDRRARFVCALCLVVDDRPVIEVLGRCEGRIARVPRGHGGFGYDPLFLPDHAQASGRTFAELEPEEKRAISHRAQALAALERALGQRAQEFGPGSRTGSGADPGARG